MAKVFFWQYTDKFILESTQVAAIELAKGQLTTDPLNHSGDELHTVIKLFDEVKIESNGISLVYRNNHQEWSLDYSVQRQGTRIHLKIDPSSKGLVKKYLKNYLQQNIQHYVFQSIY